MRSAVMLRLDRFAMRQWEEGYTGTRMTGITREDFERSIQAIPVLAEELVEGYAPFCKHLFVRNWVKGLKSPTVALDDVTRPLVKSEYQARTEKELPVLVRWVPASAVPERADAEWLDLILYSKAQIVQECVAMGEADDTSHIDYDWGIISIKAQVRRVLLLLSRGFVLMVKARLKIMSFP